MCNNEIEIEEDEQVTPVITLDEMIALLPKRIELIYVDYRDNLDDSTDAIQECITKQSYEPIDERTNEWFWEQEAYSVDYILNELKEDLERQYEFEDEQELNSLIEHYYDELRDVIYDRDKSTPLTDLLRNTDDPVTFYDTGFYIDSESWTWDKTEMRNWREKVKRVLKIPAKEHKYDSDLELMLAQASYGGRLVVYFQLNLSNFDTLVNLGGYNTIEFSNAAIAVIDTGNGSGDYTFLPGHTFRLPLDTDNITLDKTIKYNFTYEVCGMYSNWCECTEYKFLKVEKPKRIKKSTLVQEKEREEYYNKTYKAGGCTWGDMDMRRHRNTFYINAFPCGTKCPNCGTFWID